MGKFVPARLPTQNAGGCWWGCTAALCSRADPLPMRRVCGSRCLWDGGGSPGGTPTSLLWRAGWLLPLQPSVEDRWTCPQQSPLQLPKSPWDCKPDPAAWGLAVSGGAPMLQGLPVVPVPQPPPSSTGSRVRCSMRWHSGAINGVHRHLRCCFSGCSAWSQLYREGNCAQSSELCIFLGCWWLYGRRRSFRSPPAAGPSPPGLPLPWAGSHCWGERPH